jgi:hypothetical protein
LRRICAAIVDGRGKIEEEIVVMWNTERRVLCESLIFVELS